jgi:inosose dehydratase
VLERIRELGFKGFETGYRNLQPAADNLGAVRSRLDSIGLTFFGIHIFLPEYHKTTHLAPEALYTEVVDIGSVLGAQYLILSGAPCESARAWQTRQRV